MIPSVPALRELHHRYCAMRIDTCEVFEKADLQLDRLALCHDGKKQFLFAHGDDMITRSLRNNRGWDTHVRHWMTRHVGRGDTVVDVGAHMGYFTVALSEMTGPTGRVIAIEPQQALVNRLLGNLWINDVDNAGVVHAAAGAERARLQMDPVDPGNEGGTGIGVGGEWVECVAIDEMQLTDVKLMKIDVERFERQVLLGAAETIRASRPVLIVEIMGDTTLADAPPPVRSRAAATVRFLLSMGYRLRQAVGQDFLAMPI